MFLHDVGPALPPREEAHLWKFALATVGLPQLLLHSARHTTATLVHQLGVPEQVRMQILGHASGTASQGYWYIIGSEAAEAKKTLANLLTLKV